MYCLQTKYNKYKKNKYIVEFILNNYLVNIQFRNIFQIQVPENDPTPNPNINKFNKFLIKNKIPHKKIIQTENEKCTKYIFFNKDCVYTDIEKINNLNEKEFARNLGEFYIFATENYYKLINDKTCCRISINAVNEYNTSELYAQWGKTCDVNSNMEFFITYAKKIETIFHTIDQNITVSVMIEHNNI